MAKSWELTEDQKREIQKRQEEIGAEYDPETGRKKGTTENVGDNEDVEGMETRNGREKFYDDDYVR